MLKVLFQNFLTLLRGVIDSPDIPLNVSRSYLQALNAIQSYGRPKSIQLLNLIDRRFSRELPIQPDYCGIQVDSRLNEKVKVNWQENDGEDSVYLINNKE